MKFSVQKKSLGWLKTYKAKCHSEEIFKERSVTFSAPWRLQFRYCLCDNKWCMNISPQSIAVDKQKLFGKPKTGSHTPFWRGEEGAVYKGEWVFHPFNIFYLCSSLNVQPSQMKIWFTRSSLKTLATCQNSLESTSHRLYTYFFIHLDEFYSSNTSVYWLAGRTVWLKS